MNLDFRQLRSRFVEGGLDFRQVGLDFRQGGLDFRQGGLDFQQVGLDFRQGRALKFLSKERLHNWPVIPNLQSHDFLDVLCDI